MALHQWHTLHISPLHPVFNFPPSTANLQIPLFLKGTQIPWKMSKIGNLLIKIRQELTNIIFFPFHKSKVCRSFLRIQKNDPLVELMSRLYIIWIESMVYEISGAKLHSAKRGNFCMGMVQWTHVFDECKHITSMHFFLWFI